MTTIHAASWGRSKRTQRLGPQRSLSFVMMTMYIAAVLIKLITYWWDAPARHVSCGMWCVVGGFVRQATGSKHCR